jgi:hypothetical protein
MGNFAEKLLASTLGSIIAMGAIVVTRSPAQASPNEILYANKWAYTDNTLTGKAVIGQKVDSPVGVWRGPRGGIHISRQYFSFDLTGLQGKTLSEARLLDSETSVTDCAVPAPIEIWRTEPITETMSWGKPPRELEKVATQTQGAPSRCPGVLKPDVVTVLQAALNRGDSQITFEVRLPADKERIEVYGRKMGYQPYIEFAANSAPVVSDLQFTSRRPACGTVDNPTIAGWSFQAVRVSVEDPGHPDNLSAEFAVWPLESPAERVEFPATSVLSPNLFEGRHSFSYPHGTRFALAARGRNILGVYSSWSPPCYGIMDAEMPADPVVTSLDYPEGDTPSGGPGVPGTFTIDAQGDPDVVAYTWSDGFGSGGRIEAPAPGAAVTLTYTPTNTGLHNGLFIAHDRAGNTSFGREYFFTVADTAPVMAFDQSGLIWYGEPELLRMFTDIPEVTSFSYQIEDGPEVHFPNTGGNTITEVTFFVRGWVWITGRSYVGDRMIGLTRIQGYVNFNDPPTVESEDFGPGSSNPGVVGQPGTFTFRPASVRIIGYQYLFTGGNLETIAANADAVATLNWTPQAAGEYVLTVWGQNPDESLTNFTQYSFTVVEPSPWGTGHF